jgi:methylenetetrahydrofolate--tRNA-(uracil-5-)-methyltransferase
LAELVVIGGGLAGSEAAWQAAQRGIQVMLYEMRPGRLTPAHRTGDLAELVCSNSLGSNLVDRAPGLLKEELRRLGSLIMVCADATAVPAGGALAVDRQEFARLVTQHIADHPRIHLRREEVKSIPRGTPTVIATGPLTSNTLAAEIAALTGQEHLYFYDAMAPIVNYESIDLSRAFRGSRYGRDSERSAGAGAPTRGVEESSADFSPPAQEPAEEGDYINCPMTRQEYDRFVGELLAAETIPLHQFEQEDARFFEACLPVEVIARRGREALAYGPLKPVGLIDPRSGKRPYAVVQLRQDNLAGTLYNMVGFQTNLRWGEQERVFRLIPGLERAEFVRFGQMHRNTFVNSPALLRPTMQFRGRDDLFFGGQITGTEGYVGSTASGLVAGLNAARQMADKLLIIFPPTTMLGALCRYVTSAELGGFQPMKPNFGLMPALERPVRRKRDRHCAYTQRALADLAAVIAEQLKSDEEVPWNISP